MPDILPVVTAGELLDNPPPSRPIAIEDIMRVHDLVLVTASYDSFKSTLALEMAWSLATGEKFLGYHGWDVRQQQRMLVIQAEIDPGSYAERLRAFGPSDDLFVYSDLRFSLTEENIDRIYNTLEEYGLDGVVLDPLGVMWPSHSRSGEPFNENNKNHISPILRDLKSMERSTILVHHDPKPNAGQRNRASGSSALLNDPDVRIFVDRVPDNKQQGPLPEIEFAIRNRLQGGVPAGEAIFTEKFRLRGGPRR